MLNLWAAFFFLFPTCVFVFWAIRQLNTEKEREKKNSEAIYLTEKELRLEAEHRAKLEGVRQEVIENLYKSACEIWAQGCAEDSKKLSRFDLIMPYLRSYEKFRSSKSF